MVEVVTNQELFQTTLNPYLVNTRTLSTRQTKTTTIMMNVNPLMVVMAIVPANVLHIQLLKYHENDDPVIHIRQLTKVCVTNGKDTNDHKIQYFPNSIPIHYNWFNLRERKQR